jgi:signal peptidase I
MRKVKEATKKFWEYLKKDTWDSWLVSIILVFIAIKFIFFPLLSLATGTSLPLVVVESCSMYHESSFDNWWSSNSLLYEQFNINKSTFESYPLKNGFNKGDIIFVWGYSGYKRGDIIIFSAPTKYPIIHRVMSESPLETKGDHNLGQLDIEHNIPKDTVIGKAVVRIPALGWLKLIFFEPFKPAEQRGFCK